MPRSISDLIAFINMTLWLACVVRPRVSPLSLFDWISKMIKADPDYYQNLQSELTTHSRWFNAAITLFVVCLGFALDRGVSGGWTWLIGALFTFFFALWARIDMQATRVMLQIYLASAK